MIKTAGVELSESWSRLFEGNTKEWIRWGLSRFARWASLRQIVPMAVDAAVIGRFIADLETASLTRNIRNLHRGVINSWNGPVRVSARRKLETYRVSNKQSQAGAGAGKIQPASFRTDVDQHLLLGRSARSPDDNARTRAPEPRTLRLRRDHPSLAVTAAVVAGDRSQSSDLTASIVEVETGRALLRYSD